MSIMDLKTYTTTHESAAAFARRLNVPPPLLRQWQTKVRRVPADRCPTIERESGGLVSCEELRPDVDWAYLRETKQVCSDSPVNDRICANPGSLIDKAD